MWLYTSIVKMVEMLFIIEASDDTIAAIRAANTSPAKPVGRSFITSGYALSGGDRSGARMTAAIPGLMLIIVSLFAWLTKSFSDKP